ncbi:hypothetical protein AARAC_004802 [Aspergillus arachidicola]|uniref:ChrR-like cupin domain-containing protein n=2 Tax=Aspergillus arachidicola TaxID=656916 RepID=A0A2G7FI93_9EURO|nr:hypothetical protein AARAC_004802 [Aspergillus arachidicola]
MPQNNPDTSLEVLRSGAITIMIEDPSAHIRPPSEHKPSEDGGFTVHCKELEWLPLGPKVFIKIIKTVPETGEYSIMVRAEKGGVLPRHRHLDSAEIYVMKGSGAHPQTGSFAEGDYVSESKGAIHDPLVFENDTELLMVSRGPSMFLDDDGVDLYMMDVAMLERMTAGAD